MILSYSRGLVGIINVLMINLLSYFRGDFVWTVHWINWLYNNILHIWQTSWEQNAF